MKCRIMWIIPCDYHKKSMWLGAMDCSTPKGGLFLIRGMASSVGHGWNIPRLSLGLKKPSSSAKSPLAQGASSWFLNDERRWFSSYENSESLFFLLDLEKNWPLVNILMLLPMSKLVNLREYSWWIKLHFPCWAPGKTRASMSHSHLHVAAALYLR